MEEPEYMGYQHLEIKEETCFVIFTSKKWPNVGIWIGHWRKERKKTKLLALLEKKESCLWSPISCVSSHNYEWNKEANKWLKGRAGRFTGGRQHVIYVIIQLKKNPQVSPIAKKAQLLLFFFFILRANAFQRVGRELIPIISSAFLAVATVSVSIEYFFSSSSSYFSPFFS